MKSRAFGSNGSVSIGGDDWEVTIVGSRFVTGDD